MLSPNYSFPSDWSPAVLSAVADLVPGKTPSKAEYQSSGNLKVIKFRDVSEDGVIDFNNDDEGWLNSDDTTRTDLIALQPDTILLTNAAHSTTHLGKKIGYVETLPDATPRCFVGELTSIRSKVDEVSTRWLYYLLRAEPLRREIVKAAEGAHLVPYWLRRIPLAYPEKPEQFRIAETLKSADDHIRAIEEQIRRAERVNKALLQSVFLKGLPGNLQAQQLFRWGAAPGGWRETTVRTLLTEPVGNGNSTQATKPEPPGVPTLNVSSVRNGRCDLSKVTYIELSDSHAEAFAVSRDDFFVLRGNGNRDYVAIGGLVEAEPQPDLVFSDLLIRLRFDKDKATPRFMKYLWQSPTFLRRLQSYAITGSGLWKIGQRSISRFMLAIPDFDEQETIATLFDSCEVHINALNQQLNAARRVKQSLLQNLLTGKTRLKP